jgi:hypothetical protein
VDYAEAGGITIIEAHNLITAYTKFFSIGNFHIFCRHLNETNAPDKTWNNFRIHLVMAYHQHKKMQVESAATSGYANAAVAQPEDDLAEASIYEFANLTTATAADRGIVATFTDTNYCLAKQLK